MIVSDQRMPGMLGVELLARCRELYPLTRRVLLTAYSDIQAAVRAINEARLDHYLEKPWDPPDERLYPATDDLLAEWQSEYRAEVTGLRVVGHPWSARSHEVKDFLGGNLIPYRWLEVGRDSEAQVLMNAAELAMTDLPALFLEDGKVLRNPDTRTIAERLELAHEAAHDLYDLIIVGAGPAGLAAAVNGASEGLRTLLLDARGPGGQAGASARIENYVGFPSGVSGSELARRAIIQARRLGAEFLTPAKVTGISVEGGYKRLTLDNGQQMLARSVIAATGMTYREHPSRGYGGACRSRRLLRRCNDGGALLSRSAGLRRGRWEFGGPGRDLSLALRERGSRRGAAGWCDGNDVALPGGATGANAEPAHSLQNGSGARGRRRPRGACLPALARNRFAARGTGRRVVRFHRDAPSQ